MTHDSSIAYQTSTLTEHANYHQVNVWATLHDFAAPSANEYT